MKGILIQQKVFKAIDGKYPENISEEKQLKNDEFAYSSIILNLSDSVIRKVENQKSTRDLWDKLDELYTESSLPSKLILLEKFSRYKLDVSKTIDDNMDDFTKLIQDIKLTDDKNIDDYSPIVLLNAIPETYGDVKSAIKYGRDSVNLETVISGLKSKEIDLRTNRPSQNQPEVNLVRVYMLSDVNAVKSVLNKHEWLIDSGCTVHMTPYRDILSNYKSENLGSVSMANENDVMYWEEGLEGRWGKGIMKIMKGSLNVFKAERKKNLYICSVTYDIIAAYVTHMNTSDLWHKRLGHISSKGLELLHKHGVLNDKINDLSFCDDCILEAFEKFKTWKTFVENQIGKRIKVLRTDNGLEFCNKQFSDLCDEFGIKRHNTTPYTPQQNGVAERMNRTLLNKVRCLLISSDLPKTFWGEALLTVAYLINRSPSVPLSGKLPECVWSGKNIDLSSIRIFGCSAFALHNGDKLDPRAQKCIFIGYPIGVNGYRLWLRSQPGFKVIISRDVTFNETEMSCLSSSHKNQHSTDIESIFNKVETDQIDNQQGEENEIEENQQLENQQVDEPQAPPPDHNTYQLARDRERREPRIPTRFSDYHLALNTETIELPFPRI
ncbi:UNVERIFIED_CONTAM: Retrovirus-related Pol polyprotein from transposon TNT 1-94 [Sesamum latifolium]|uniref:Retrovirus-related Pol polyprotein from transposon TNT 1-94 n=1 Tax=Sesamum latifolium TaxID=2727402 RepID=A0AAW2TCE3_9LAMI